MGKVGFGSDTNDDDEIMRFRPHLIAFIKILGVGKMKVNGMNGNWSNGFMGSRWCDLTYEGRTIRYAYYSITDTNNKTGRDHIHVMSRYFD